MQSAAARDEAGPQVGVRAWASVLVLTLIILLSFVDRSALSLVAGPVRADLKITNVQLSYLLGTSFALFYSLVGLPSGYLVDRLDRRRLMFFAVIVWSAMTALCGFAQNFATLFVGRLGVGLGEAAVSPVAFSIIRDAFPSRLRARAMSVFYIGSACGTGAALLVVGALLGHLHGMATGSLPVVGSLRPWQLSLVIIGLAGFPLSMLIWTMRDPPRRAQQQGEPATMSAALTHFWNNRRIYLPLMLSYGFSGIASAGSNSWLPTYVIHTFHLSMHATGAKLGQVGVIGSFLGMVSSGYVLDKVAQRWGLPGLPVVGCCTLALSACAWFSVQYVSDFEMVWLLLLFANFITPWAAIAGAVTLSRATPGSMIGKFTAIYFLVWNLMGYGLGPTLIAELTDHAGFTPATALGQAISLGPGAAFLLAGALMLITSFGLQRTAHEQGTSTR